MKPQKYLTLKRDDIEKELPYRLICETIGGCRWNTGSVKKRFREMFYDSERAMVQKIEKDSYSMYLGKGVPDKKKMSLNTYRLWKRLGDFCASI